MEWRSRQIQWMAGGLALLSVFASYLAMHRIYQVDEAQNLFMARILATHQDQAFFANALLWMLGPLSWLSRSATASASLFESARLGFLGVFFLNTFLMALNSGVRLRSAKGLAVLLGAATLAPMWDYGFEIRHDNLILTGLLLIWWLGRTNPKGRRSYLLIGFLSVALVFVAFKSFAYVLPLSAALLLMPPPGHRMGRGRLAAAWLLGAGLGGLVVLLAYGSTGTWSAFLGGFQSGLTASEGGSRFGAWLALGRLFTQTPLWLGVVAGALVFQGWDLNRRGRDAASWEGTFPETLLFLGALSILLVNPTPFPYNLVNLVPFGFILGIRFLDPLLAPLEQNSRLAALSAGVLCFTQGTPFLAATWRHLDWTNERQETLMRVAEALTGPADPVYDAIGMVPTRPSIGFHWYLHSLNIRSFAEGKVPSVPQMLSANPAAVFIPNYRTDWLPASDHQFIRGQYLPLADDFWVLGQILPTGGGTYHTVRAGRYLVLGRKAGSVAELIRGNADGQPLRSEPLLLTLGPHRIECSPDVEPIVAWVGPSLDHLPRLPESDHRRLFVNWY